MRALKWMKYINLDNREIIAFILTRLKMMKQLLSNTR